MTTHQLHVPDMSCGHCIATVEKSVGAVAGVESVAVDLDAKSVRIAGGDESEIRSALAAAGYAASEG